MSSNEFNIPESVDDRLNQLEKPADERLRPYGVSPDEVEREELVVEDTHEVTVDSAPSVVELRPDTLSEMKEWIGVDDESAPAAELENLPSRLPSVEEVESVMGSNTSEENDPRDSLNPALNSHLFSDSRTMPNMSGVLNNVIGDQLIQLVPFKTIHIKSGGVLNVGSNVSILFADAIRIENGGTLQYEGGLKIDTAFLDGVP